MAIVLKKPILVVGVSLSFLLWLGNYVSNYGDEIGNYITWLVIFLGGWAVIFNRRPGKLKTSSALTTITTAQLETKIDQVSNLIDTYVEEAKTSEHQQNDHNNHLFREKLEQVKQIQARKQLKIGLISHKIKSDNLYQFLTSKWQEIKFEHIDLTDYNINLISVIPEDIVLQYDLIFFSITDDLTEEEKDLIINITEKQQKILIIFDNVQLTLAEEIDLIEQSIKNSLQEIIEKIDIVTITSGDKKRKIIKYKNNLEYQESEGIIPAQYEQLTSTFEEKITPQLKNLITLTSYRNVINLENKIKINLNQIRKTKAVKAIEKYQLVAATATLANPVASLDLLATAAVNSQMIVDLSKIYQQQLSLNQAQEISIAIGKLMLKLGIVEVSTQLITNILKTNALTFVAGGIIQGISAAYLTRICGLSLVEYYQELDYSTETEINLDNIKAKIQHIFGQNKGKNIISQFVQKTAVLLS